MPGSTYPYPGSPGIHPTNVAVAAVTGASLEKASTFTGMPAATITLSGSPASGDTVTATINGHPVTYTLVTADTLATAATALAADINADATDTRIVSASAAGDVVTVESLTELGTYTLTAGATGIVATASGAKLDYADGIVVPKSSFSFAVPGGALDFYAQIPKQVDAGTKAVLEAEGLIY